MRKVDIRLQITEIHRQSLSIALLWIKQTSCHKYTETQFLMRMSNVCFVLDSTCFLYSDDKRHHRLLIALLSIKIKRRLRRSVCCRHRYLYLRVFALWYLNLWFSSRSTLVIMYHELCCSNYNQIFCIYGIELSCLVTIFLFHLFHWMKPILSIPKTNELWWTKKNWYDKSIWLYSYTYSTVYVRSVYAANLSRVFHWLSMHWAVELLCLCVHMIAYLLNSFLWKYVKSWTRMQCMTNKFQSTK